MKKKNTWPGGGERAILAIPVFLMILAFSPTLWAQENRIRFDSSGSLDWIKRELNAQAALDLAQAGIKIPTGRSLGEEALDEAYPRLLRPYLLPIQVDSNSTIMTLIDQGQLSLEELDELCQNAEKIPHSLSADLTSMTGRYTVILEKISALLAKHRQTAEPMRPLRPVQTANYTGIIIIVEGELPIHGRRTQARAEPCLFPKIWDTDMNLIYERNMFNPNGGLMVRYVSSEDIFRPTPSGLEGELAALAGPNPLRIIAREVYGVTPTDPVIDKEDALKILSSENNRRLLGEGRVIMVLDKALLRKTAAEL